MLAVKTRRHIASRNTPLDTIQRLKGTQMTNTTVQPSALTVWGAMQYTGLSRTRLYKLMKSGDVVSFTVGSRRMFRRTALDDLIDKLAAGTPGQADN